RISPSCCVLFSCSSFYKLYDAARVLHSFPTRRSSDLIRGCSERSTRPRDQHRSRTPVRRPCDTAPPECRAAACDRDRRPPSIRRSEEHTSELQSRENLVCRLLLEKKKTN